MVQTNFWIFELFISIVIVLINCGTGAVCSHQAALHRQQYDFLKECLRTDIVVMLYCAKLFQSIETSDVIGWQCIS